MAHQKVVLCDTDVIIEFYKNNLPVVGKLKKIGQPNIAVSVITTGELIFGALNKKELNQILKDISHLQQLEINPPICIRFLRLMESFSLSHNLAMPDAIIAATALYHEIPLYTLNLKDFKFITGLNLYQVTV